MEKVIKPYCFHNLIRRANCFYFYTCIVVFVKKKNALRELATWWLDGISVCVRLNFRQHLATWLIFLLLQHSRIVRRVSGSAAVLKKKKKGSAASRASAA